MRLVIALLLLLPVFLTTQAEARPVAYKIADVPNHKQITGLHCGAGALQSVLDYWGPDISQREIANVARTSSVGTYSFDMVRTGQFSHLSSAQGQFYPSDAPTSGFTGRSLGYASFGFANSTPWLEEAKDLVAQDIPVIMLMLFAPAEGSGGHYRVMVGYDDNLGVAYFVDPWDRNLKQNTNADGTITWSYSDLLIAWNYGPPYSTHTHFGAAIMPWKVALTSVKNSGQNNVVTVTAKITYPCPKPFACTTSAQNTSAKIQLPAGVRIVSGSQNAPLGALQAGETVTATWKVAIDQPSSEPITVTASGYTSAAMPAANWWGGNVFYPPYSYTDEIGGEGTIIP